jgi:hypothetical protein
MVSAVEPTAGRLPVVFARPAAGLRRNGSALENCAVGDDVAAGDFDANIFTLERVEIGLGFPDDLAAQMVAGDGRAVSGGVAGIFTAVAGAFDGVEILF